MTRPNEPMFPADRDPAKGSARDFNQGVGHGLGQNLAGDLPELDDTAFMAKLDAMLDGEMGDSERDAFLLDSGRSHHTREEVLAMSRTVAAVRQPVACPDLTGAILARVDSRKAFLPRTVRTLMAPARLAIAASVGALVVGLIAVRLNAPEPIAQPGTAHLSDLAAGGTEAAAKAQGAVNAAASLGAGLRQELRDGLVFTARGSEELNPHPVTLAGGSGESLLEFSYGAGWNDADLADRIVWQPDPRAFAGRHEPGFSLVGFTSIADQAAGAGRSMAVIVPSPDGSRPLGLWSVWDERHGVVKPGSRATHAATGTDETRGTTPSGEPITGSGRAD